MPVNGKDTYYEFFGLENFDTNLHRIKKAYHRMALKWHPDRVKPEEKSNAERMMKQVNEVWRVLSTEKTQYDRYLKRKMNPAAQTSTAGADAWSNATGWSFDFNNMEEMIRRMKEEENRRSYQHSPRQQAAVDRIINKLKKLNSTELERIEGLINMAIGA